VRCRSLAIFFYFIVFLREDFFIFGLFGYKLGAKISSTLSTSCLKNKKQKTKSKKQKTKSKKQKAKNKKQKPKNKSQKTNSKRQIPTTNTHNP
jgi:hypothetical protein